MHRLLLALCFVLLVGCDSAGDDVRLAIPATPEENTGSFRLSGLRFDQGTGFGEDVSAKGALMTYTYGGPDGGRIPGVFLTLLDWTTVDSEPTFHNLRVHIKGLNAPGTYDLSDDEVDASSAVYFYGTCTEQLAPVFDFPVLYEPCEALAEYRFAGGTLDIHELDETGLAGEFELELESEDGTVLRVTNGRTEIHFSEGP